MEAWVGGGRGGGGGGGGLGAEPAFAVVVLGAVVSAPLAAGGEAFAAAGVGGAVVDGHFEGRRLERRRRIKRRRSLRIGWRLELRRLWMHLRLVKVWERF